MELSFIASVFKPFPLLRTPFPPFPFPKGTGNGLLRTGKAKQWNKQANPSPPSKDLFRQLFYFFFLKQSPIHLLAHRI